MRPVEGQPKSRQPISQAILFIIGGGSYIEYQVCFKSFFFLILCTKRHSVDSIVFNMGFEVQV